MRSIWIIVTGLVGAIFVLAALLVAHNCYRVYEGTKRWVGMIGGILIAFGGAGFFLTMFAGFGGLRWLPSTFQWPIGRHGVQVTTLARDHVVAHKAASRIQVYNADWRFVRGWWINSSGGALVLRLTGDTNVEIFAARGAKRYVYNLDGTLMSEEKFPSQQFPESSVPKQTAVVPTNWWLWPMTSPLHSFAIVASGAVLLALVKATLKKH